MEFHFFNVKPDTTLENIKHFKFSSPFGKIKALNMYLCYHPGDREALRMLAESCLETDYHKEDAKKIYKSLEQMDKEETEGVSR